MTNIVKNKWGKVKLQELILTLTDYHANGSYEILKQNVELLDTPAYAAMIRTTNFEKNDFEDLKYINEHAYNFLEKSKVHPNDILMNKIANAGSVYLMPDIKKPVSLGMNLFLIRIKPELADQKFVYYYLKTKEAYVKSFANGAATNTITKESVRNLEIITPNPSTQSIIASIISAYDRLIENNEKRIKLLGEMAQRLYTEWFVKFKFPDHEKVKIVNGLPKDWGYKRIDEIAEVIRGISYSSEQINNDYGDYYLVNLKSFNRGGGFRFDGVKYFNGIVKNNQLLKQGDIVVAVTDMTTDRAVIARPARIPNIKSDKITFSADVVRIVPGKLTFAYVYYSLLDYRFTETTKNKANGANVLHLKPQAISEYKVLVPTLDLLEKFERACCNTVKLTDKLSEENEELTKIRDLLIPQLVAGKRELKN